MQSSLMLLQSVSEPRFAVEPKVMMLGSYSKGNANPDIDIDVAVIVIVPGNKPRGHFFVFLV